MPEKFDPITACINTYHYLYPNPYDRRAWVLLTLPIETYGLTSEKTRRFIIIFIKLKRKLHVGLKIWSLSSRGKKISLVRCAHSWNIFFHSKINFICSRHHVISSILFGAWRQKQILVVRVRSCFYVCSIYRVATTHLATTFYKKTEQIYKNRTDFSPLHSAFDVTDQKIMW